MTTTFAGNIRTGDKVRTKDDPFFREVVRVERSGDGTVVIEVEVGNLIEKLPPMRRDLHIEVDR